jgi:acetyl-CoA carboxylase biotin carboxylase subunit
VEHFDVGLHYDPLLGKLIVHAASREEAILRMRRALRELQIEGVRTTQPFHLAVMDEPDFRAGRVSVRYIESHPELLGSGPTEWHERAAIVAATLLEHRTRGLGKIAPVRSRAGGARSSRSEWRRRFDVDW